jgi:VWFA-related protein
MRPAPAAFDAGRATRPKILRRTVRAGACLVAAAALRGGNATTALAATTQSEFPAQVEVVTVDAVVVDANGRPVEGLTRDDFVVEEDGQPQAIVKFEPVSVPPWPEPGAVPEPSWAVTNSGGEQKAGRAFAILVDDLRLPFEQSEEVRRVAASFVTESLSAGDAVIVATTSGRTWWADRVREGREDLLAALEGVKGRYVDPATREHLSEYEAFWITHREASATHQDVQEALRHASNVSERVALRLWGMDLCGRKAPHESYEACFPMLRTAAEDIDGARRKRTAVTLQAIAHAIDALAGARGRKSLVFLSPGFLEDEDLAQEDVAAAALDSRVALYFIDARGLITGIRGAEASGALAVGNPGVETQSLSEDLEAGSGGARALAEETGGFSQRNTNDLAAAAERIAAESRAFYLLGFQPPLGKPPRAWRKLRVTVRREGVTVRARRGYRLDAATVAAMSRVGGDTVIPLRLAAYLREPLAGDRVRVVAAIEIDMAALADPAASGESRPPLQLRLEATPRGGGEPLVQDVSLQSADVGGLGERRPGPEWRSAHLECALEQGVYELRAFVKDPRTGRSGVVVQRVAVPKAGTFRISTPVIADHTAASGESRSRVPAYVAHDRFTPGPGQPIFVAYEVFGAARGPGTGQSDVSGRVALQDGTGHTLTAPVAARLGPSPGGRLQQVVGLPPLPPGDYELVIAIEDRVTGATQEARRSFGIQGLPSPRAPAGPAPREGPEAPTGLAPELAAILERAGRYVSVYGETFSSILAEEDCRQVYQPDGPARGVRDTRAGVFFVTLPGPLPWATFRDVWEVDGNKVGEHTERLARLFRESPATATERARAILKESARYNLGPVRRTVNIPTLALLFLHPSNQSRFAFDLKGKGSIQGRTVVEVAFKERGVPTLVAGDTSDGAPAQGRVWIDPKDGAVLKTDVQYDINPRDEYHRSWARIVTQYRQEPRLGILVPGQMKETYQSLASAAPRRVLQDVHSPTGDVQDQGVIAIVVATTRYSRYVRTSVSTDETYTIPPAKE